MLSSRKIYQDGRHKKSSDLHQSFILNKLKYLLLEDIFMPKIISIIINLQKLLKTYLYQNIFLQLLIQFMKYHKR